MVGYVEKGKYKKMKESELQKICIERLLKHPCVWGWRNNSGAVKTGKRFFRYGYPGSADFIGLLSNGKFLAVEFKSEKGKQSEYQKEFERNVTDKCGIYEVISSLQAFNIFYDNLFAFSENH